MQIVRTQAWILRTPVAGAGAVAAGTVVAVAGGASGEGSSSLPVCMLLAGAVEDGWTETAAERATGASPTGAAGVAGGGAGDGVSRAGAGALGAGGSGGSWITSW